jgi:GTPase SAR1 family protein
MGACGSGMSAEDKTALANSKKLEMLNKQDHKKEMSRVKLLLLGTGESGKSTIFKQLKILYSAEKGYTSKEREQAKPYIYGNVFANMKVVVENTDKYGPIHNESAKHAFLSLLKADDEPAPEITPHIASTLKHLWNDPGIQATWKQRANFQVQDALKYYLTEIDRIAAPHWTPSDADILRSRVRTTGIQEETYIIDKVEFAMFDVGGQRNERKKWIHCFDQVTAVIFVAAISEYNQVLYEDNSMNRIVEALLLFEEIANSKWFKQTSIILFLNKRDLFAEKICEVPFRGEGRFDDFKGPHVQPGTHSAIVGTEEHKACYDAAVNYLKEAFLARNKQQATKEIYTHVTCATDTKNVEVVFNACKDIILKSNLHGSGFM